VRTRDKSTATDAKRLADLPQTGENPHATFVV
jgi:hypothetical protein